jgi:dienelactone hydrolase
MSPFVTMLVAKCSFGFFASERYQRYGFGSGDSDRGLHATSPRERSPTALENSQNLDESMHKNSLSLIAMAFATTLNHASPAQTLQSQEEGVSTPQLATDLNEAIAKIPVTVQPLFGDSRSGEMIVTHFKPPGDGPFPVVIMHHGRAQDNERANPGRWRYTDIVRYWTRRGFAVFVPTRLGYGDMGLEPDPEFTGPCNQKRYDVAAKAASIQSIAAIDFAIKQPWADKNKVIVMGQSMGGFTTVATMERKHPSVIAGINFAGGGGGDPKNRSRDPCSYAQLGSVFASAGKANAGATPMLWLYAENDNYWGASIPRKWHDAYVSAGGKAEFVMFPPIGSEGHSMIGTGRNLWRPVVDKFIAQFGIKAPKSVNAPAASNYAALDDASKLPNVKQDVKDNGYKRFLNTDVPRAFAIGPKGEWNFQSGDDAIKRTLERCAQTAKTECKLYAVDDAVVWVE